MRVKGILSERYIKRGSSFQIVSEWEDAISEGLGIKKYYTNRFFHFLVRNIVRFRMSKIFVLLESYRPVNNFLLHFDMEATTYLRVPSFKNIIPIIIDFWLPKEEFKNFYLSLSNSRLVLVTSRQVYELLTQNACPIPIAHFPLSIPDQYISEESLQRERKIDFVFAGRKDPIFFEYVCRYEQENPCIEYVYKPADDDTTYVSNKRGRLTEDYSSRQEYTSLIQSARIAFYSTPGKDPSKENANGYNQVTPRFLELISNGCLVMARFDDNGDVDFFELNKISFKVNSYDDFRERMELFSDMEFVRNHKKQYYPYLKKHSTSSRINMLRAILNDYM